MNLKAKVILPVMTLAAAAILAACGGGSNVTPVPVPASAPAAAPAAAAPAPVQSSQTLESVVVNCGTSQKNEVFFSIGGKEQWRVPVGNHMSAYSSRVAGVELPQSTFECVAPVNAAGQPFGPVYDPTYQLVFAYGQDASAAFPAELAAIDAKTGKEVGYLMHPGHIKGVVPVGKMDTPKGSIDVIVVTAVSNVRSLVQQASRATGKAQPYVPVAMAVDSKTMEVIGYLQLGSEGQPLFPTASRQNGSVIISYTRNADGNNTQAAFAVSRLFTPDSIQSAKKLVEAGAFK